MLKSTEKDTVSWSRMVLPFSLGFLDVLFLCRFHVFFHLHFSRIFSSSFNRFSSCFMVSFPLFILHLFESTAVSCFQMYWKWTDLRPLGLRELRGPWWCWFGGLP